MRTFATFRAPSTLGYTGVKSTFPGGNSHQLRDILAFQCDTGFPFATVWPFAGWPCSACHCCCVLGLSRLPCSENSPLPRPATAAERGVVCAVLWLAEPLGVVVPAGAAVAVGVDRFPLMREVAPALALRGRVVALPGVLRAAVWPFCDAWLPAIEPLGVPVGVVGRAGRAAPVVTFAGEVSGIGLLGAAAALRGVGEGPAPALLGR
jgi:hypothetical protein